MKSTCYKCADRYVGCHSECEKYKEFTAWNDKRLEDLAKEVNLSDETYRIRQSRFDKNGKLKRRGRKHEKQAD